MSRKPTIPITPISAAPTRPTPPAPQFLAKLNHFEQAGTYRPDADVPTPKKKDLQAADVAAEARIEQKLLSTCWRGAVLQRTRPL